MRVGHNPHKDQLLSTPCYLHQVVIPVYIPHQEGYFKDSFKILQLCINSLVATVRAKTCISIVNNGSCDDVKMYLNDLYEQKLIQELIHTENIGKLNAILKGMDEYLLEQEKKKKSIDEINGDKITLGSLEDVTLTGNWPKKYGSNE